MRIGMPRRCAYYFAYFTADGKQIEPVETVSFGFRHSDLFRDSPATP